MRVKDIPGYEGLYLACDEGYVISCYRQLTTKSGRPKSKAGRVLTNSPSDNGYCTIQLYDESGNRYSKTLHRIIAEAFVEPGYGETVNHIDGDRANNHYTNLEWCNAAANIMHGHLRKAKVRLTASQIMAVRELDGVLPTNLVAQRFNVDPSVIFRIWNPQK